MLLKLIEKIATKAKTKAISKTKINEAKKILLKAIKKGLTRKMLVRLISINKVEIFVENLRPLANIE